MSTHAEILDVHKAESKLRLKPHLVPPLEVPQRFRREGPLSVTLEELLTPETVAILRHMMLVP